VSVCGTVGGRQTAGLFLTTWEVDHSGRPSPASGRPSAGVPPRICLGGRPTGGQSPCPLGALADPVVSPRRVASLRRPRPPVQGQRGGLYEVRAGAELSGRLRTLARREGATTFMAVLLGRLPRQVSLQGPLKILFERSGARVETDSPVLYGVQTAGLSVPYHRLLAEIVAGLWAMDLRYQGKPGQVRLKATPP